MSWLRSNLCPGNLHILRVLFWGAGSRESCRGYAIDALQEDLESDQGKPLVCPFLAVTGTVDLENAPFVLTMTSILADLLARESSGANIDRNHQAGLRNKLCRPKIAVTGNGTGASGEFLQAPLVRL